MVGLAPSAATACGIIRASCRRGWRAARQASVTSEGGKRETRNGLGYGRVQCLRAGWRGLADRRRPGVHPKACLSPEFSHYLWNDHRSDREPRKGRDQLFSKGEFRTPSGRSITFQSARGSSTATTRIGDSITVRYRLDQPQVAEIDAFMPLWGKTLVFGALGGVFLFVGAGILTGVLAV
jgi:hypothetical protein